jgi:hypothetical protein
MDERWVLELEAGGAYLLVRCSCECSVGEMIDDRQGKNSRTWVKEDTSSGGVVDRPSSVVRTTSVSLA